MKNYKLILLLSPDLSEEEAKTQLEKTVSLVKNNEEVAVETRSRNKIRLGHSINKKREAYYCALLFSSEPEKLAPLKDKLKAETAILRWGLFTNNPIKEMPAFRQRIFREAPIEAPVISESSKLEKKVELKEIEEKLEKILSE